MTLISRSTFLEYSILFCRVWLKISTQKSRSRIYPTRIWKILNFKFCLQAIITQIQTVCTFVSQWKKKKKTSDKNGDIDTDLINTCKYFFSFSFFFCYLIKEVPITKYGNDKQLMLNLSPYEIISFLTKC